ncbi:MAG: hypothetical protein ACTHN4_06865 [Sphingomicrobium sp.]
MTRLNFVAGAALAALAAPALADHTGPSGVGSGSGLNVFAPDTLDEGHAAIGLRVLYTRPEHRSDSELEALAAQHVHAHNADYNLNASAAIAYGVTHRLTISAELPYLRRDDLREGEHSHSGGVGSNSVEKLGTVSGIGDLNLLAKYRLTGEEGLRFALVGGVKVPTGSTHERDLEGERLETEHQPGTGSWDPIVGASAAIKAGAVQLAASGLYQFAGRGAQATKLGDRLQGGISVSHHFGRAVEEHHSYGDGEAEHHHHEHARDSWDAFVEIGGEWEGRQDVAGIVEPASGGSWVYAAPGVRFNSRNGWSAGAAVALPVWQHIGDSHPDNRFRAMLSLGKSF